MTSKSIKLVMVPWGADVRGDDVWLIENALMLAIESIFEKLEVPYADLYDQLNGDAKKTSAVRPYQELELLSLAGRAPADTTALVDGLITIIEDPNSSAIVAVELAPRIMRVAEQTFELPDAFRFHALASEGISRGWFDVEDQDQWFGLTIMVAESILSPFGISIPADIGPETLRMTDSWPAYLTFIKAKRGARTIDEKLGYYRQSVRHDPQFFWARFNGGQLFKQQEDYHSARREFLAAIEGAGSDAQLLGDTYFELGLCSVFLGDTKTARNFWDQALAYAPGNPVLLVNVAGTYEQEEDWQNAIRLHQAALDINPEYYKALVSLARLKAQTGMIDHAVPLYEKALALKPDDPLRHAILGGCYLSQGDEIRARQMFEKASRLDPPGNRRDVRIDEADGPPAPGDYARKELAKLDDSAAKEKRDSEGGWKWFGR